MKFIEWFNVNDIEHITAYRHFNNTGMWPEGFIPDGMELPDLWTFTSLLTIKMSVAWVDLILQKG